MIDAASHLVLPGVAALGLTLCSLQLIVEPSNAQPLAPRSASRSEHAMLLGVAATGTVKSVDVSDGNHVAAGQLLLEIDCSPLEQEVMVRTAALSAAEAAFDRTRAGTRPEQIASGEAEVGVSKARSEEAQDQFSRSSRLTLGSTITQEQLFRDQRDARIAAAQLDDSEKKLALLETGSRIEDVEESKALRDEAKGRLDEARSTLSQCSIRAPSPGTVQILANVGEFVSVSVPVTLIELTPDKR
jgi:multidrug resistance efflux pump